MPIKLYSLNIVSVSNAFSSNSVWISKYEKKPYWIDCFLSKTISKGSAWSSMINTCEFNCIAVSIIFILYKTLYQHGLSRLWGSTMFKQMLINKWYRLFSNIAWQSCYTHLFTLWKRAALLTFMYSFHK